tara:strand:+ start:2936 stop:3772 length:837 start_codon:yes stop_codon:yes gene_type:complete
MKISVATTYTNPDERQDPWREAISCYEDFADEIIVTGQDWPYEFSWDYIGKTFNEGFKKAKGDWVFRMDIDYFLHEKDIKKVKQVLTKYNEYPAVCFPQYQFFLPNRFQLKTRLCVALNKKRFPNIELNGGGDMCLATLNSKLITAIDVPNTKIPIYQYDSMFRTKKIIAEDRSRFAKAWFNHFGDFGDRGGQTPDQAYSAWYKSVESKYQFHTNKIDLSKHPKYIKNKIENLSEDQFGYSGFGLKMNKKNYIKNFLVGKKDIYIGPKINNVRRTLNF